MNIDEGQYKKIKKGKLSDGEKIEFLKMKVEIMEETLIAFQRSLVWKIWRTYTSMIDRILPLNTFRRSVYDSIIEANQRLINDGIKFNKKPKQVHENNKNTPIPTLTSTSGKPEVFGGAFPQHTDPRVSIIIPSFNNTLFLHQTLHSILEHTPIPYELIIVDNDSIEDTKKFLSRLEGVTLVYNKKNEGFGAACNQGAALARAPYILFLNNDTIVTNNWLPPLITTMDELSDAGAVGGKKLAFNGLIQEAGGTIMRDGTCKIRGSGKRPSSHEYSYFREVDHCSAACLLVKKSLFEKIGGFDERYSPAYYEDIDLSMAMKHLGYKIYYQPSSVIYHNQHTSSSKLHIFYFTIRNKVRFKKKWADELAQLSL